MPGGKDLICLFLYHSEVKAFLFFRAHSPHLLFLWRSPPRHTSSKSGKCSCNIIHADILILIFIITATIIIVIAFLVTRTAVSNLIGNLKWHQKLSAFPLWGNLRLFLSSLLVVFGVVSLRLDVSNLPVKIPQQTSSARTSGSPRKLCSSSVNRKGRCHCECRAAALD